MSISHLKSRKEGESSIIQALISDCWGVAICGPQGVGKTTTAYGIATDETIRSYFTHGIVWIGDLEKDALNYASLIQIYKNILSQLSLVIITDTDSVFENILYVPSLKDEERNDSEKEATYMARDIMASLLFDKNLLICVDGANDSFDLDLFDFRKPDNQNSSIKLLATLVNTTNQSKKKIQIWTLDNLDPEETYDLLVNEIGEIYLSSYLESFKKDDFVSKATHGLPLAIRILGCLLKDSCDYQNGVRVDDQICLQKIKSTLLGDATLREKMFIMLSSTLSQTSLKYNLDGFILSKCFVGFISIFSSCGKCYRPWIPKEPIRCLFRGIIDEGHSYKNKCFQHKTLIDQVIDNLVHVGFFSKQEALDKDGSTRTFLQIQHDIYQEFGEKILQQATVQDFTSDLKNSLLNKILVGGMKSTVKKHKISVNTSTEINSYLLRWQPYHLLKSGSLVKVSKLLYNSRFAKRRISYFGLQEATELHVADCERLWQRLIRCHGGFCNRIYVFTYAFKAFAKVILRKRKNSNESKVATDKMKSIYQALWKLAYSLFVNGCVDEAFDLLEQTKPFDEKTCDLFLKLEELKKDHRERSCYNDKKMKALNLIEVGYVFAGSMKNMQTIKMIEVGLNDLIAILGHHDLIVARKHICIGELYSQLGLHQEAIKKMKTGLSTLLEILDENDIEILRTLWKVADSYSNLHKHVMALEIYLMLLPVIASTLGNNSQEVIQLHVMIGKNFFAEKRYLRASMAFKQARCLTEDKQIFSQVDSLFSEAEERMKEATIPQ